MLLLISEGFHLESFSFFFFFPLEKSHLIGPPPIFLEHGALPNIEAYVSFLNIEACFVMPPLLYNLYTWKLNHS
jgi:hypothetical protein